MVKKKLNIAIFHCGFVYSGGGERIVLEQAIGLKKRGHRVRVYAPTIDTKLCYPKKLKKLNVKMFLPSYIKWLPFRDALRMVVSSVLAPILAFWFKDVDIFIGANQPGAWIAFCMSRVLKKPYLVYMNQPNRLVYPRPIDKKTGWYTRKDYHLLAEIIKVIKPFIAWADRVSFTSDGEMLVNGDYMAKAIREIYKKQVVLCPGGAYPQPSKKLVLTKSRLYEGSIKIKNKTIKKPYMLITNRHEPQKKFDYVIKAFELVLQKTPDSYLVIPSPFTDWTKKLQSLAKKLNVDDKVLFLGQITEDDLQRLYRYAAVYCYPSPDEDFGLGPLEAAAWAIPTVAWNHGGPAVTVKHGKTGWLSKPYQVEDYARGIIDYLSNPKKRILHGQDAYNHLKQNFSWQKHIEILEKEIKRLL